MSAQGIVVVSTALQAIAAWQALRLARKTRRPAWLLLALAILLMLIRRTFTLWQNIEQAGPIDLGAELIALLISLLMALALVGLSRSRSDPEAPEPFAEPTVRLLTRSAVLIGLGCILGSAGIGYHALRTSRASLLHDASEHSLNLARTLAAHCDAEPISISRAELFGELDKAWRRTRGRYAGTYLCVLGRDGTILVHTRDPARIGGKAPVPGMPPPSMSDPSPPPPSDWAGAYHNADGEEQLAAVAYTPRLDAIVTVRVPARVVAAQMNASERPWTLAFAVLVVCLLPVSLTILHWSYTTARDAAARAEGALRLSQVRLTQVVASAPVVLFAVDRAGVFTLSEGKGLAALGLAPGEVVGRSALEMYHEYPAIVSGLRRALAGEEVSSVVEVSGLWFESRFTPLRDARGEPAGVIGLAHDITEFKRVESELLRLALHDPLTGLPNRALLMDRLGQALARSQGAVEGVFAVLFLDLDRFKVINDSLGHTAGDQLLIATARMLAGCLRPGDTVARLGGDEFTVLVERSHKAEVLTVAEDIHHELRRSFDLDGHEAFTSASIGIAMGDLGQTDPADILRDADTAMYEAKALGRARTVVFDPTMHHRAVDRLRLETDLRRAIERQEFRVHYQSIVSLTSGRLAGFEALARWQHGTRGLLLPEDFLRVAEETGLIVPMGRLILREACRQMRVWTDTFPDHPPLAMVVNLSGRQWSQPNIVEEVRRVLSDEGLDERYLRLKITEGVLMESASSMSAIVEGFRKAGIHTYIDDFGTGHSSLSSLHDFAIEALKIDRSFIARIGPDGENTEIVRSIIALGHHLGKTIVAEGVETPEQLRQLRALECDYGQGNYLAFPLDGFAATELIAAGRHW